MRSLGPEIRHLRKQAGLTQRQVAERAGCTHQLISEVERGSITPSLQALEAIAVACGGDLRIDLAPDPLLAETEKLLMVLDAPRRAAALRVLRLAQAAPGDALSAVAVFLEKLTDAGSNTGLGKTA